MKKFENDPPEPRVYPITDAVGYKKPPERTQFQKGRSGNPTGRPKKPKNSEDFAETLRRVLNQTTPITKNGRRRQVTKFEAFLTQLIDQASTGNLAAGRDLIKAMTLFKVRPGEDKEPLTVVIRRFAQDPYEDKKRQ